MKWCFVSLLLMLSSASAFSSELEERDRISAEVQKLFHANDFQALNTLARDYLETESRTKSGLWKFTLYSSGLSALNSKVVKDVDRLKAHKNKIREWSALNEKASFPHMYYARVLLLEAWAIRGPGWGHEVREEDWFPFRDKLEDTRLYLKRYERFKGEDPQWYEIMMSVAKAQNWEPKRFSQLLNEALEAHPGYYELYFRAINYLQPRWHGSPSAIEQFAQYALAKSKHREGYGLYTRVYWYVSQAEYGFELFEKSHVQWDTMKLGIQDILEDYPDQWNINNFALFACLASDREMTRDLLKRIEGMPIVRVWKKEQVFNFCTNGIAAPDF